VLLVVQPLALSGLTFGQAHYHLTQPLLSSSSELPTLARAFTLRVLAPQTQTLEQQVLQSMRLGVLLVWATPPPLH